MILIDTHTHIYEAKFDIDRAAVIQRAKDEKIVKMILPGIDSTYFERQKQTVADFPDICKPAYGLHPTSVKDDFKTELKLAEKFIRNENPIAIGEIGIDLYWDKSYLSQQIEVFEYQVSLAKELNLPIIIHVREAFEEVFKIIDKLNDTNLKGVFHSFTGNLLQAQKIIEYGGFKMGINGIVTYKKSDLPDVVKNIAPSHFLLETDSPWLPPVPHRGKRNEPAFMIYTAQKIAEIFGISLLEMAEISTKNTLEIFPSILD